MIWSCTLLLFLLLGPAIRDCSAQDHLISDRLGNFERLTREPGGMRIKASNGWVTLTVYKPTVVRVRITRDGAAGDSSWAVIRKPQAIHFRIAESAETVTLSTDSMRVVVSKQPLSIDFYNAAGKQLSGDDPHVGVSWQGTEVTDYQKLYPAERFIGLGEKTGPLDRRAQHYTDWNTDAYGYGLDQDPIYSDIPFFMGIHDQVVYGLFFDNTYRSHFNFGASTDDKMYYFGAESGPMNYYFFSASSVAGILKDYTWLTGRIQLPPLWSLGYQQSRYSYMNADQLLNVARRMRRDSIPCDVLYCDIDYMRGYRVFTWNPKTFPHPKALTDSLRKMGIHLVTIIDPGIKIDSDGYAPYQTGVAKGYFARYPDGRYYTGSVWAGRSHFPDFIQPAVRQWWGNNFKGLVSDGVTGFWNDMNEPSAWGQDIPPLITFGTGPHIATLKKVRNVYGMQMARATYEGTRKLLHGRRPFVLTRAAYAGIQRYSAMWTGDNNPTDDHMLLGFRLINSMGLGGEAFVGMDVGGFSGNPTPELMVRWMSLGTFTPMFRNHTAKGNTYHEPWAWGENDEPMMRASVELRYRLLPYLYSVFYQATQTGMPVNRTLAIQSTFDSTVYQPAYQNEFMFGPGILVAPVSSKELSLSVYFPRGEWYRFSTDKRYKGMESRYVSAPLDDLPVFVKAGAIVPMQSVTQSTSLPTDGCLYLHVWYGADSSHFVYYEDDGVTDQNLKGDSYKRLLSFYPRQDALVLGAATGSYSSRFKKIRLVLHGFPSLKSLRLEDAPLAVKSRQDHGRPLQIADLDNKSGKLTIRWQVSRDGK